MTAAFSAVGIVAADMARSLAFYRRLGLDIPAEAHDQPHAEVELPGGTRLMWDAAPGSEPAPGGVALAFACDGPGGVDSLYADLLAAGYTGRHKPWDAEWGQRYALVLDPDGNWVDLFAPLE